MNSKASSPLSGATAAAGASQARGADLTGMNRIAWNVISSWGAHLVFVVAGFIMPRMIDRHVGQVSLGVWDFCWSVVNYFGLTGLGIGTSVNRHVAMYRAAGDMEKMRRSVSSVVCLQAVIGSVVLVGTTVTAFLLPYLFTNRLRGNLADAQWLVALLGASVAVTMGLDSFRGIITGCHRWDLHNGLNAGSYALTVGCMFFTLVRGGGLRGIALVYLIFVVATEVIRVIAAHRVCPELKIRVRYAKWKEARHMLAFGGNSLLVGITPLVVGQATSILIASYLGPASLALFSRPTGLVRSGQTFLNKFAFVLTPTAGSLVGSGRTDEIRKLLLQTTRMSVALALPMVLFLSIQGDVILRLWMGQRYEQGAVLAILALGAFLPMTQQSTVTILMGLNLHGRIGIISLVFSVVWLAIGAAVVTELGWTLPAAALLIAIPLALGNGLAIAVYACYKLKIGFWEYLKSAFIAPFLCVVPFAACLVLADTLRQEEPWFVLLGGCALGALVTAPLYYLFVFPRKIRDKVNTVVRNRWANLVASRVAG